MDKIYNFSAGPAILPGPVFDVAARAVRNLGETGLSVLEISHRSKEIVAVMDEAVGLVRELLQVPESHKILFLQGGASLQFCMVPYNLLSSGGTAGYVETGVWAKKAIKEARFFGEVNVLASSAEKNFTFIPKSYEISKTLAYLHLTSNNTIYGTQLKMFPQTNVPLVSDMSSDIFSRPVNVSQFGVIYAGAQKNLGPAGITLAIVREDLLGKIDRIIPTMLDYRTHIDKVSMFNTPPVFALFVVNETLKWLKASGGVSEMEKINRVKADKLYTAIDGSSLFQGTAELEDRSRMNVTFVLSKPELEPEFLSFAVERGLSGLKGHRSVGGFRASIYNAMPEAGIDALIACMGEFEKAKG